MGYRSDVEAVFYTKEAGQFGALKLFIDENFPEALKESLAVISSRSYYGYKFSAKETKWYEGFAEVREFNSFIAGYAELLDEVPWQYEFVRIGEDLNDIDDDCRGNDVDSVLRVERTIECDF